MTIAEQLKTEGRQQGTQQTLREGILEILEVRFYIVPYGIKEQLDETNDATALRRLHRLALQAESIDAFTRDMAN